MTDRIDEAPLDDDLTARFARLERVALPDNWDRVAVRTEVIGTASTHGRRWWAAGAAAVIVIAGVGAVAALTGGDGSPEQDLVSPVSTVVATTGPETFPSNPAATSVPALDTSDDVDAAEFGSAIVEPGRAAPGDVVTVTPSSLIQPTCTDLGAIFDLDEPGPTRLGIIGGSGLWVPELQQPTIPPCLPPETDQPFSYVVPPGLGEGTVAICRAVGFDDTACGPLEILTGSDSGSPAVAVPVVEGLTEGEAVTGLRSLDFVVVVERVEVGQGDASDGRVVSQSPVAATEVEPGSTVNITIGQAPAP